MGSDIIYYILIGELQLQVCREVGCLYNLMSELESYL